MSLIDKIRRARETTVEAGGHSFTVRRPTDEEWAAIHAEGTRWLDVVKRHVADWNLKEIDVIPGGDPVAVPFDSALFAEWVADKPDLWTPIGTAVVNAYKAHAERREAAVKN